MALQKVYTNNEYGINTDFWIITMCNYTRTSSTTFDLKVVLNTYKSRKDFKDGKKEFGRHIKHFTVDKTNYSLAELYNMMKEPSYIYDQNNEPIDVNYFSDALDLIEPTEPTEPTEFTEPIDPSIN